VVVENGKDYKYVAVEGEVTVVREGTKEGKELKVKVREYRGREMEERERFFRRKGYPIQFDRGAMVQQKMESARQREKGGDKEVKQQKEQKGVVHPDYFYKKKAIKRKHQREIEVKGGYLGSGFSGPIGKRRKIIHGSDSEGEMVSESAHSKVEEGTDEYSTNKEQSENEANLENQLKEEADEKSEASDINDKNINELMEDLF
jgi:hypothetical protein